MMGNQEKKEREERDVQGVKEQKQRQKKDCDDGRGMMDSWLEREKEQKASER